MSVMLDTTNLPTDLGNTNIQYGKGTAGICPAHRPVAEK